MSHGRYIVRNVILKSLFIPSRDNTNFPAYENHFPALRFPC